MNTDKCGRALFFSIDITRDVGDATRKMSERSI